MAGKVKARTANRIQDRLIDELIGICRGVIADDRVDENEAIYLGRWIENHRDLAERWPVNVLYARLTEMLKDGVLSRDEEADLLATLKDITGDGNVIDGEGRSTRLPLDKPLPEVAFKGKTFCLTGRFVFGSNLECEETIFELGGRVVDEPDKETDYLVIGELSNPEWSHTTFGKNIEQAIELRDSGASIAIISEEHWVDSMSHG